MSVQTYAVPPSKCPCGMTGEAATSIKDDRAPIPGDITLCFHCGRMLQFDANLHLQVCDQEEILAQFSKQQRESILYMQMKIRERNN
jgi:hypothetical protein